MRIVDLEAILEVNRMGSISKASEELYVTQPVLSKMIHRAEKEIGATLFQRVPGKSMILTPTGTEFVAAAQQMVDIYHQFLKSTASLRQPLRIGVSPRFMKAVLDAMSCFDHELEYSFVEVDQPAFREEALLAGNCDVIVTRLPLVHAHLEHQVVYREKFGIWLRKGAAGEALARKKRGTKYRILPLQALDGESIGIVEKGGRTTEIAERTIRQYGIAIRDKRYFSSTQHLLSLAERGNISTIYHQPEAGEKKDRFFLIDEDIETYDLALAWPKGSERVREIKELADVLREACQVHYGKNQE